MLTYLEEAIVQTYSLLRNKGITYLFEGITFPVKNGYFKAVMIGGTSVELPVGGGMILEGLNFGTIVVGTQRFLVTFVEARPRSPHVIHRRR